MDTQKQKLMDAFKALIDNKKIWLYVHSDDAHIYGTGPGGSHLLKLDFRSKRLYIAGFAQQELSEREFKQCKAMVDSRETDQNRFIEKTNAAEVRRLLKPAKKKA